VRVTDDGTGQELEQRPRVVVVRGPRPAAWAGPSPLGGGAALVVAAGLDPRARATLAVGTEGALPAVVSDRLVVRPSGRLALVFAVPASVADGEHAVSIGHPGGRVASAVLHVER
jgi:hypothetical protein